MVSVHLHLSSGMLLRLLLQPKRATPRSWKPTRLRTPSSSLIVTHQQSAADLDAFQVPSCRFRQSCLEILREFAGFLNPPPEIESVFDADRVLNQVFVVQRQTMMNGSNCVVETTNRSIEAGGAVREVAG